uniref:Copia protein n=1 Tax=Tanacetum cinerariifolium TaxID=118510 RepID=A0A699HBS6_TANCI|nr:copia protein [Tanacetum cinerariifolium]
MWFTDSVDGIFEMMMFGRKIVIADIVRMVVFGCGKGVGIGVGEGSGVGETGSMVGWDGDGIDGDAVIFNTIITSLKALDESFSSRNDVRKFLRALPSKWRSKVMTVEESKDLSKLSLDELVGNLKVYEVVLEKDLKSAKKNIDVEYATVVRDFKKFFRRRGKFVRQPYDDKKKFRKAKEDKKEDLRCFKCGDPNHFISESPKNSFNGQKAFVVGCWSDSEDDKKEICLMACENEVRQKVNLGPDEWIKDSGFSRHMTCNKELFSTYKAIDGDNVLFGSNTKTRSSVEVRLLITPSLFMIKTGSEILKDGITRGKGIRENGLYIIKMENSPKDTLCLTSIDDTSTLWYRILGHANMRLIQSLSFKELVRDLPKLNFEKHFCDACNVGKQVHESHKAKNMVSTTKCLELLHMDSFGPSAVQSYRGNFYTLVIIDDYSRYSWIRFLKQKNEAFDHFEILSKKIQIQKGCPIILIRTDHGREFDNEVQFRAFCDANRITRNFLAPRTPQSNGGSRTLLYLTASRPNIMFNICLCAHFQEAPKTSHFEAVKRIFRHIKGDYVDCKSTSGVCTFMGCCLTSWFSKKQTALAISTTEADYVSARKSCQQAFWMKQALVDYGIKLDDIPVLCDNKGAIDLSKNPILYSRTKNIEICHHFLRDNVQKGNISIEKVASEDNIVDILTKPLKREPFNLLRLGLGLMESNA